MDVRVTCITNLDVNEEWPSILPCRPVVGDIIRSKRGLRLRVVSIEFDPLSLKSSLSRQSDSGTVIYQKRDEPIIVELHLLAHGFVSISDFQNWYQATKHISLR